LAALARLLLTAATQCDAQAVTGALAWRPYQGGHALRSDRFPHDGNKAAAMGSALPDVRGFGVTMLMSFADNGVSDAIDPTRHKP
jgi:hypothetical protein